MKLYELKEKCMAATKAGVRCKNGGSQRHAEGSTRYAVCGQHAEMLMAGKPVTFVTHITAENVKEAVGHPMLPGIDDNATKAREALTKPNEGIKVELFYVTDIKPNKVLVVWKETITIQRWSKALIMLEAVNHMPNVEGSIKGMMARSGTNKAVWNRNNNGWVEKPVPFNLTMIINNKENN